MTADKNIIAQIEKATSVVIDGSEVDTEVKKIVNAVHALSNDDKVKILLQAVNRIDLTSLKGGETFEDINKLCQDCKNLNDFLKQDKTVYTAAVCVYPASAQDAIKSLKDLNLRDKVEVASVAADFPAAKLPLQTRIDEIKLVVGYGVDEVDVVINRQLALENNWLELYNELKSMREACGKAKLKTILATGDLPDVKHVYVASMVAMLAGSDFIKTSTGKETVNATLTNGVVMCKAIKDYYAISGRKIGLKPAGGIVTAEDALQWMTLVDKHLGKEWCTKDLFRIGASRALTNIITEVQSLSAH
ncbi:deoxyribose-phosphate aldolase isoform X2 [Copidosoma floridanum]|uniref:deoxyribose-phosphate aldolase isoform X2 n=1 Tax=Copidosoma floridanum TaxID=29053 RepID=UPI000C6F7638|nr:deoxyribose-phosphate aldolase isoform X2 [Copidosoma floridanum]